jgi:hypothetical protein
MKVIQRPADDLNAAYASDDPWTALQQVVLQAFDAGATRHEVLATLGEFADEIHEEGRDDSVILETMSVIGGQQSDHALMTYIAPLGPDGRARALQPLATA